MSKLILFDTFRIRVLVPEELPRRQARRMTRLLGRAEFRRQLARRVRAVFRNFAELEAARVRLSS